MSESREFKETSSSLWGMLFIETSHLPGSNLAYLKDAGVWQCCELGRTPAKKAANVPKAALIIYRDKVFLPLPQMHKREGSRGHVLEIKLEYVPFFSIL